jgi:hypothetical protein
MSQDAYDHLMQYIHARHQEDLEKLRQSHQEDLLQAENLFQSMDNRSALLDRLNSLPPDQLPYDDQSESMHMPLVAQSQRVN